MNKYDHIDGLNLPADGGRFRCPIMSRYGAELDWEMRCASAASEGITCMRCRPLVRRSHQQAIYFIPVHDRHSGKWHHPDCVIVNG